MTQCLIVDDSEVIRKLLRRIVEDAGFACHEAANGEEAYNACRAMMPDIILIDWDMPVMNGLEFTKKLRKTVGGERPKIIFCTSESDIKQIKRAVEAGANEYVMKPFDAAILQSKLSLIGMAGNG